MTVASTIAYRCAPPEDPANIADQVRQAMAQVDGNLAIQRIQNHQRTSQALHGSGEHGVATLRVLFHSGASARLHRPSTEL